MKQTTAAAAAASTHVIAAATSSRFLGRAYLGERAVSLRLPQVRAGEKTRRGFRVGRELEANGTVCASAVSEGCVWGGSKLYSKKAHYYTIPLTLTVMQVCSAYSIMYADGRTPTNFVLLCNDSGQHRSSMSLLRGAIAPVV